VVTSRVGQLRGRHCFLRKDGLAAVLIKKIELIAPEKVQTSVDLTYMKRYSYTSISNPRADVLPWIGDFTYKIGQTSSNLSN